MSLILTPAFFANGAVVICAVGFAALGRDEEKKAATLCASALVASWMVTCASFTDWGLHKLLGHGITFLDIWSIMNALVGIVVILLAKRLWWGWPLFGLMYVACANDLALWATAKDLSNLAVSEWAPFSARADGLFWSEAALFFAIGAGGAANLITRNVRRCFGRGVLRPVEPARAIANDRS